MSIPTALFKRRCGRGREPVASARYAVRRSGGGTSLMVRRSRVGQLLPQRRPLAAGSFLMARRCGRNGAGQILLRRRREDRISALPDDLLLLILRRLDTRSALGAGSLSKRWAHLPRELTALDLRASDVLPPRYHRWVDLYNDIRAKVTVLHYRPRALTLELLPNIRRYERRAMRAFTCYAVSLLEGPRRRVKRLSLEFFITGNAGCMNRLVAEAIDAWGVEDLEVVAKPTFGTRGQGVDTFPMHTFPSHGLCKEPRASRLRSLKLGGCVPTPLHEYNALTMLVLQGLQESTPLAVYEDIFNLCPQLQTLHLISCGCSTGNGISLTVAVDAPRSQIRELVVENCTFRQLLVRALPCLECLASLRTWVFFESSSSPCLSQRSLAMRLGAEGIDWGVDLELDMFLEGTPGIRNLIIRFTGPYRWIVPSSSPSEFLPNLRRLLVADVPSTWDVTWPRLLLETSPSLEILHIHIAHADGKEEPSEEIPWSPMELLQHHLKEFVVVGFKGTARQICLVKFVVGVCTALCHLAMFKNGHVRYRGHWDWDWEMVTQEQSWSDEEKGNTLKQIMDMVSSTSPVQLVLG